MAVAVALLAGGCSSRYPVEQETACQRRMVQVPAAADVSPQRHPGKELPAAFETISRRYAAMDQDGCTDAQRAQIAALVRRTHTIATLAARLPKSDTSKDDAPMAAAPDVQQFQTELQAFESRRLTMQRDLDRMEAVRLR